MSNENIFLEDFLVVLKRILQNLQSHISVVPAAKELRLTQNSAVEDLKPICHKLPEFDNQLSTDKKKH